jgi:CubicO group peptidase (beta-lactamase class C family)
MALNRRAFLNGLGLGAAAWAAVGAFPRRLLAGGAPRRGNLPRSSPEAQGVDSNAISGFLAAWDRSRDALHSEPHSFMMVRHGHVVAEGWWAPYRQGTVHLLHSLSKSFTSTAVGFAVAEGRLGVEDRIAAIFPELLPQDAGGNLGQLRVRDLLTMSVGRSIDDYSGILRQDDWVREFLSLPIEKAPGSTFSYDNWASFMLSAVVQRRSDQALHDYLRPRFFDPIEAGEIDWEFGPHGINTGGWGLSAATETVAKLGQFYLRRGLWNGRQLLGRGWVEEATTFKIQQPSTWRAAAGPVALPDPDAELERLKATNDWYQGYCYQFWRCRHNAYRGDGAFGQFCIVIPDQDAVIAITSETGDMQGVLNLVWDHLLPAMHDVALPDAASAATLRNELASLALPPPAGARTADTAQFSRRRFRLEPNALRADSVLFDFRDQSCVFTLTHPGGSSAIHCGMGRWVDGSTDMPGTPPVAPWDDFPSPSTRRPAKVAAACAWKDGRTLELQWRYYEKGNRDTVTCRFDGNRVDVEFLNSITQIMAAHPETRPMLTGRRTI